MKVKELIEKLQAFNGEAEVLLTWNTQDDEEYHFEADSVEQSVSTSDLGVTIKLAEIVYYSLEEVGNSLAEEAK